MHGHEERAARLPLGKQGADQAFAVAAFDSTRSALGDAELHGVARMDFGKGLGDMGERRALLPVRVIVCQWSRMRPVLSVEREIGVGPRLETAGADGDETRLAIGDEEAAIGEEAGGLRRRAFRLRPLERLQRLVGRLVDVGEGADIEVAAAVVFEGGQSRVLGKDLRRRSRRRRHPRKPMRRPTSADDATSRPAPRPGAGGSRAGGRCDARNW